MSRTLTALLAAVLLLAACGDETEDPGPVGTEFDVGVQEGEEGTEPSDTTATSPTDGEQAAEASAEVTLINFEIEAPALVDEGVTAIVRNQGEAPHTFTALDGNWDTGTLAPGEQTTVTFTETGTFEYQCTIHPQRMGGVIEVESAG